MKETTPPSYELIGDVIGFATQPKILSLRLFNHNSLARPWLLSQTKLA
jgi:hypothetical protein